MLQGWYQHWCRQQTLRMYHRYAQHCSTYMMEQVCTRVVSRLELHSIQQHAESQVEQLLNAVTRDCNPCLNTSRFEEVLAV
jgi:predicted component of type VI protein secretion system